MKQQALGSGFIIDKEGHVVTNAHVIDGADKVKVRLADDREYRANVVGKDARLDVAVLKLQDPPAGPATRRTLPSGRSVVLNRPRSHADA